MEHYIESDHPHIAAFMDIGTNSVRLLVVRVEAKQAYRILTDQKETVRLGESEFIDQRTAATPPSAIAPSPAARSRRALASSLRRSFS